MAKGNDLMVFRANTVQENERMLQESCSTSQLETKSKEDFEKLFLKLNYACRMKANKEEARYNGTWCGKNNRSIIYGPISGFPSGSWWGIRMDCSRDRVHDPFDKNTQNGPFGVASICTSSTNVNEDVDRGNALTLTGQKYTDDRSERDPLVKNYEGHVPVRLVRSYNLFNEFAPKTGYRYDGLYIVANFWIGINVDRAKCYKFALLRLTDQEPPFWGIKQPSLSACASAAAPRSTPSALHNCSKSTSSNTYDFKKSPRGSESVVQDGRNEKSNDYHAQYTRADSKRADEREKSTGESAIVTRHVFKKTSHNTESVSSVPSMSVAAESRSLTLIGDQRQKAHSTNISIRTGLYNSSHSAQLNDKKNASPPFARTAKPHGILKTSNQYTENWGSSGKEKNRNANGKSEFSKRVNYIPSCHAAQSKSAKMNVDEDIGARANMGTSNEPRSPVALRRRETARPTTSDTADACDTTGPRSFATPTNLLNITNCMYKNGTTATHKTTSSRDDVHELKSLDSYDSLTPDKILHLINNKAHPLSKLLMGNMIGLTSEQSIALQAGDSAKAVPDADKDERREARHDATRDGKQRNGNNEANFEIASDDLSESTVLNCYKFRRRRKLSKRITKQKPEAMKYNAMHKEKLKKGGLAPSSDIFVSHLPPFVKYNDSKKNGLDNDARNDLERNSELQNRTRKKKSDYSRETTKNRKNKVERRMRLSVVRTINSSIKKHINKKQRREITNLLIDAKIGPKIRGPRYRRLRCISSNAFAKQSSERPESAVCMVNKCRMNSDRSTFNSRGKLARISSCRRVRSSGAKRESKVSEGSKEDKIDKNPAAAKKLSNQNDTEGDICRVNGEDTRANTVARANTPAIKNRKRKFMQTALASTERGKNEERSGKEDGKESVPSKADAVTQCSLIREPLPRSVKSNSLAQSNARKEQYTFIKVAYGDVKDTKSETWPAAKLYSEKKYHSKSVPGVERTSRVKEQRASSLPERTSAFVPVNILDNEIKIARLRSIGFKPIECTSNVEDVRDEQRTATEMSEQNVAEKYNKYANEENDIVVYMDDELQYQDIENEDRNGLLVRRRAAESMARATNDETAREIISRKDSNSESPLDKQQADLESPWHGWKKIVTNEDTYWVGW